MKSPPILAAVRKVVPVNKARKTSRLSRSAVTTMRAIVLDAPDWRDRIDDEFKSRDFMEYVGESLKEHGINTGKYEARRPGINEEPKKDKEDKKKQNNNNNNGRPRRPDRWDPVKKKWV